MAGHSKEKEIREFKQDLEPGAEFYIGTPEGSLGGWREAEAPYKLEPNASDIEDFLTRLRQEGL